MVSKDALDPSWGLFEYTQKMRPIAEGHCPPTEQTFEEWWLALGEWIEKRLEER